MAELQEIISVANELGSEKLADQLHDASRQLEEDVFRVVVMGEFSNGKSTLINALLGEKLLPSSTCPTTTLLTVIKNGPGSEYRIVFSNGLEKTISSDEFKDLVAPEEPDERDNEDVRRFDNQMAELAKVNLVTVSSPNPLCSEGVVIVDTPGTNDLDAMRERITYEFVPKADAAIVVLSARQPLSAKELDFITGRILPSDVGRLFFVVNFKDFLRSDADLQKQTDFILEHLGKVVERPRLHFVCSRDALVHRAGLKIMGSPMPLEETGIPALERALSEFLESSQTEVKIERPTRIGTRVATELITGPLAIRRSAIGLAVKDIRRVLAVLEPEFVLAKNDQREVISGLRAQLDEEGEKILSELKHGLESVVTTGVNAAREFQGELTKENIIAEVENAIGKKHSQQIEKSKKRQKEALKEHCTRAQKRMQAAWEKVDLKVKTTFDIKVSSVTVPKLATDDGDVTLAAGGGIGTIALVALAHIAFPIAIIAGVLGFLGIGAYLEESKRKKALDEIVPQIRTRLAEGIPPTIEAFESEWRRVTNEACKTFDEAFAARIDAMWQELSNLESNYEAEQATAKSQTEACDQLQARLEQSVERLKECKWSI